jgi:hypothetical protein
LITWQNDNYKTKFCSFYPDALQNCEYGKFCSFAHSEEDVVIELIHNLEYDDDFFMFYYKTVWCPFNLTQHDKVMRFRKAHFIRVFVSTLTTGRISGGSLTYTYKRRFRAVTGKQASSSGSTLTDALNPSTVPSAMDGRN